MSSSIKIINTTQKNKLSINRNQSKITYNNKNMVRIKKNINENNNNVINNIDKYNTHNELNITKNNKQNINEHITLTDIQNKVITSAVTISSNNQYDFLSTFTINERAKFKIIDNYMSKIPHTNKYMIKQMINRKTFKYQNKIYKISLRFLEWFVLSYSINNNIKINKKTGESIKDILDIDIDNIDNLDSCIDIYIDYKAQTQTYTKQFFDPFRRTKEKDKIFRYPLYENEYILTTIAQLNFFKWIFEQNIIVYLLDNYNYLRTIFKEYSIKDRQLKLMNKTKKQSNIQYNQNIQTDQNASYHLNTTEDISDANELFTITI